MPLITSSAFKLPPPPTIWIRGLGGTGGDEGRGIATDASGNVYIAGYGDSAGAGLDDVIIAKYDSSGTVLWQRALGGASNDQGYGVATDASGNVYVTGLTASAGAGANDFVIAKYNTSGVIQWQRALGIGASENSRGIATDPSGNVYVTGISSLGAGGNDFVIAKYNTSGTIQWQRAYGGASGEDGQAIATDASGNVYVTGYTQSAGAGGLDLVIAKYNTSGVIQWQRALGTGSSDRGWGIATDTSGNVYVTGETNSAGAGGIDILIAKYNSSGTIQWQRALGGTSNDYGYAITADALGNVYVTGRQFSADLGSGDIVIAKYNSSGTIQWQRRLGGINLDYGWGITTDASGNAYVTGYVSDAGAGANVIVVAFLPGDGTGTGIYGGIRYQATGLTSQSISLTDQAISLTDQSISLTDQAISLTDQSISLTETVIV